MYIPTRADFADVIAENAKSSGGYVPTAADFANILPNGQRMIPLIPNFPAQPQGFLSQVANSAPIQSVNDLGGNVVQGLTRGIAGVGNLGVDALKAVGVPTGNFQFQQLNAPFVNPNDKVANMVGQVAQYAPLAAASGAGIGEGASALGKAGYEALNSPLLKNMLSGALTGYGATDASQGDRAKAALMGGALGVLPSLAGGTVNTIKALFSKNIDSLGTKVASNFYGSDVNPGQLNSPDTMMTQVKNVLKNNFSKVVNQGVSKFQDMFEAAKNKGYNLEDDIPSYKEISNNDTSAIPDGKMIKLGTDSQNQINDILNDTNIPLKAKKVINAYKDNPNLQTLHSMQSDLFKTANGLNPDTILESNAATKLTDLRDSILDDIHDSFDRNGDLDLSSRYKQAQQFWASRVIPYQQNPLIRQIVNRKSVKDVLSKLGTYEVPDSNQPEGYQMIRSDIAANPDQARTITGAILSKGAKPVGLNYTTTTKDLLNAYAKAPDTLKQIANQVTGTQLTDLNNVYNSKNIVANFLNKNKGKLAEKFLGGMVLGAGGHQGWNLSKDLE